MSLRIRIGVIGNAPLAALWALVLRDYGRHLVVGYKLAPEGLRDSRAAQSWSNLAIAEAPNMRALFDHADIAYVFGTGHDWSITCLHSAYRQVRPILVMPRVATPNHLRDLALGLGRTPLAYNPLEPTDEMDRLASPERIWIAADIPDVVEQIEQVWRPIVNTAPLTRATFSTVSETGFSWPSPASKAVAGMSGPLLGDGRTERPSSATDR